VAISAFKVASTPLAANFSSVVCLRIHCSLLFEEKRANVAVNKGDLMMSMFENGNL
jgi:hypothetical protein